MFTGSYAFLAVQHKIVDLGLNPLEINHIMEMITEIIRNHQTMGSKLFLFLKGPNIQPFPISFPCLFFLMEL